MRAEQYLRTFIRALDAFTQTTPLAKFLPNFFRQNKQMGSSDRRTISRLLYNYFRLGNALKECALEQRLSYAEFLCSQSESSFLQRFRPDLNEHITWPISEKVPFLKQYIGFHLQDVFPFTAHLSSGIEEAQFLQSFFIQPDLYIRIHPGKEDWIKSRLSKEQVSFRTVTSHTLALANSTPLDRLLGKGHYEVQDLSSQQTAEHFKPQARDYWWDACAASGGKSLCLLQEQPNIQLLVSDVRTSILKNLDDRFDRAGIKKYSKKVIDLAKGAELDFSHDTFDGIILDAPCTGSGTWGRTPELISGFKESSINTFQKLQQSIASHILSYLKPNKPLIYITCSVFKEENEEIVDFLIQKHSLRLESMQILKGYEQKADTMFVARLLR